MIDLAEGYADGNCEREVGQAIKELGHRRSDWIITTKVSISGCLQKPHEYLNQVGRLYIRSSLVLVGTS